MTFRHQEVSNCFHIYFLDTVNPHKTYHYTKKIIFVEYGTHFKLNELFIKRCTSTTHFSNSKQSMNFLPNVPKTWVSYIQSLKNDIVLIKFTQCDFSGKCGNLKPCLFSGISPQSPN